MEQNTKQGLSPQLKAALLRALGRVHDGEIGEADIIRAIDTINGVELLPELPPLNLAEAYIADTEAAYPEIRAVVEWPGAGRRYEIGFYIGRDQRPYHDFWRAEAPDGYDRLCDDLVLAFRANNPNIGHEEDRLVRRAVKRFVDVEVAPRIVKGFAADVEQQSAPARPGI